MPVLETHAGKLVAIEVKAAATVGSADSRGLVKLREARRDDFVAGAVLSTGAETKPLGERIWAVPVSGLWTS